MVGTIPTTTQLQQILFHTSSPSSGSFSNRLCHLHPAIPPLHFQHRNSKHGRIRCTATSSASSSKNQRSDGGFQMENLTGWLLNQEREGNIDAELAIVLSSISLACKQIASLLQRASISKLFGSQGTINVQGEDQRKLDVISNEVFCNCLRSCGRTGIIASEEEDVPIVVEETYSGNYTVVFDPIDGSANIDTALTTGSIFGIYRANEQCLVDLDDDSILGQVGQKCITNVCQPGKNLLAAGYCMYSSSLVFVLSVGKGVFSFTLDPRFGEFILTQKNIQIPKSGNIYSFNEANYELWDDKLKKYIDGFKETSPGGKRYKARYIGCLVGEIHRTLLYGGIYGNPSNSKSKKGNLRLLYECAPMSYLVEQAGGKGSNGHQRILDIEPDEIHQRVPIFIGSPEDVDKLEMFLAS